MPARVRGGAAEIVPKSHLQMIHGPPQFEGQQVVLLLHVLLYVLLGVLL